MPPDAFCYPHLARPPPLLPGILINHIADAAWNFDPHPASPHQPLPQDYKAVMHRPLSLLSPLLSPSLPVFVHLPTDPLHVAWDTMYVLLISFRSCLAHALYVYVSLIVTSSMPFIPPPYSPTRRCPCGVDVPLRFVVAANVRNAGRPYYSCEHCHAWFRWGDGLGSSPRTTPTTSPAIEQGPSQAEASSKVKTAQADEQCRYARCTVTRVGRNCQRRMCRKHCRAAGGCSSNGHSSSDPQPLSSSRPSSSSIIPVELHGPNVPRAQIDPLLHPFHGPGIHPTHLTSQPDPFSHPSHEVDMSLRTIEPDACTISSSILMSQIDPLLHPQHESQGPSSELHARPVPSMSQIDPLLRPPEDADPPSIPNTDLIPPLTSQAAVHLTSLSSSSSSSFPSRGSSPTPTSSSSSSFSVPTQQSDKRHSAEHLAPSRLATVDASINPRYSSQLRPIFVDHVADVHARAEQKRKRDQELLQDKKKMRERVIVFSFSKDDAPPITVDFQDGFTYPYFKLSESVLSDLELVSEDDKPCRSVHYFDPALDTWLKMKVDSVIELTKPMQKLFLKKIDVTSYPSFDRHLEAAVTPSSRCDYNPRISLSQERSYVKRTQTMTKARALSTLEDLVELTSDEETSDALPVLSSQKRRMPSSQPLPPSQRPRCECGSGVTCTDKDDVISLHDDDSIGGVVEAVQKGTPCLIPGTDPATAKFPSSFYAVDVQKAFAFQMGQLTVEAQFTDFFGLAWKSSTYYDHRARWISAPRDAKDRAVAAGYTEEGEYRKFLAAHAAKNADLKAAQRKLRVAQRKNLA